MLARLPRDREFDIFDSGGTGLGEGQVKVTFSIEEYGSKSPIRRYVATVQVKGDQDAGRIVAFLIFRTNLKGKDHRRSFHYWLNVLANSSKGSESFATNLFDACGSLKERLHGNFGAETDQGEILYIRNVSLKKQYRRQGLGCTALRMFLRSISKTGLTWHHWWFAVMHNEACETSWRPAGFRVINHTCYLATCAQEGHACRLEHEADPPLLCHKTPELLRDHKAVVTAVCTAYTSAKAAKLLRDKAPLDSSQALHYAAASGKPDWVRWLLKQGANVNQQDAAGNTALHAAAHMGQPECVRVLLNQKADCTLNNTMGCTPLDVCSLEMQYQRELSNAATGFTSYDAQYMKVVQCFQQASDQTGLKATLPFPQNQLGCTCGTCSDGFFSQRMRLRIQTCAKSTVVTGLQWLEDEDESNWPQDVRVSCEEDEPTLWLQQYIPLHLQSKMTLNFAKGFYGLAGIMSDLLSHKRKVTAKVLRVIVPVMVQKVDQKEIGFPGCLQCVAEYLEKGGRVEYAMDAVLAQSSEDSEVTGDGGFIVELEEAGVDVQELHNMPKCENDNDYCLLLRRMCDDGLVPSGPYGPVLKRVVAKVTEDLSRAFVDDNIQAYA